MSGSIRPEQFAGDPYDGHTLSEQVEQVKTLCNDTPIALIRPMSTGVVEVVIMKGIPQLLSPDKAWNQSIAETARQH